MCSSFLSLYVPIISDTTSEMYIKKMFLTKNIGKVARVDFVKNKTKNRREAFIHFEEWFESEESKSLKEDVLNPETKTQFKYNNTNRFWPLLVNKNSKTFVSNPNYIQLTEEEVKSTQKQHLNLQNKRNFKNKVNLNKKKA